MRKRLRLFSFVQICVFCIGLSLCFGKDALIVKDGCYVPLFKIRNWGKGFDLQKDEEDHLKLSYEVGLYGTNCEDLVTVLLPKTLLEVPERGHKLSHVIWHVNRNKTFHGLVHNQFLSNCCKEISEENFTWERHPMALTEIGSFFKELIEHNPPYCWGGNYAEEISLPVDYQFSQKPREDEKPFIEKKYRLCGFDCSGLLYFISGGLLEHSSRRLREYKDGKLLCRIRKDDTVSVEDLKKRLTELKLQDSDCIVVIGHVVVWYNEGLLEFHGKDCGCVYTKGEEAVVNRLMELIKQSRARPEEDSDVRWIRWHPELLEENAK